MSDLLNNTNDLNLAIPLNNGVPNPLTQTLLPYTISYRTRNASFYVQDQWTHGRMTLQGALRFDRNWSFSPEQTIPASAFPPVGPDVPGDARRQRLQGHLAARRHRLRRVRQRQDRRQGERRQVPGADQQQQQLHPVQSDPKDRDHDHPDWTDADADFVPDCDLRSPVANGECAAMAASTFGTATRTTAALDPKILDGWSRRSNDWQIGASVQQQMLPRVSVEAGYFHRWLNNFTVTDNQAVGPADFTQFSVTAPSDPRLPGGGGYPSTVSTTWCQTSSARSATTSPCLGLRRAVSALPRRAGQRQRQAGRRPDLPVRRQQRQDGPGQLRGARAGAGAVDHRPRRRARW